MGVALPRPSRRRPNIDRAHANSPYACELIAKILYIVRFYSVYLVHFVHTVIYLNFALLTELTYMSYVPKKMCFH